MFLFLKFIIASNVLKELPSKDLVTFYEEINAAEDQYANLSISVFNQTPDIYYRIIPPSSKTVIGDENSSKEEVTDSSIAIEEFEKPLERSFHTKLEAPGIWTIQVYNRGTHLLRFSIASHSVKKVHKGNEDVSELRNLLNSIQSAVEALSNENYYATTIQKGNIVDANRIKSTLNWLLFVPFIAFGISWFKYVCARQLVRPKGKRFRGLF